MNQLPVFHRRVPDKVVHSASSSSGIGPGRWVCPKRRCSTPGASVSATRAMARRPARRSSSPVSSGLNGPRPSRLSASTAPGIVIRPSMTRATVPSPVARLQTLRDIRPLRSSVAPGAACASPS